MKMENKNHDDTIRKVLKQFRNSNKFLSDIRNAFHLFIQDYFSEGVLYNIHTSKDYATQFDDKKDLVAIVLSKTKSKYKDSETLIYTNSIECMLFNEDNRQSRYFKEYMYGIKEVIDRFNSEILDIELPEYHLCLHTLLFDKYTFANILLDKVVTYNDVKETQKSEKELFLEAPNVVNKYNVVNGKEMSDYVTDTLKKLRDAIAMTLGPYAKTTIVADRMKRHSITKDGYTVLRSLCFEDEISSTIFEIVLKVSKTLVRRVGKPLLTLKKINCRVICSQRIYLINKRNILI